MTTEQKQARLWALQQSIKEHKVQKIGLQSQAKIHVIYYELPKLLAITHAMIANEKLILQLEYDYKELLQEVEGSSLEVIL